MVVFLYLKEWNPKKIYHRDTSKKKSSNICTVKSVTIQKSYEINNSKKSHLAFKEWSLSLDIKTSLEVLKTSSN